MFGRPVRISLPLNGLSIREVRELQLVYRAAEDLRWHGVEQADLRLGADSVSGLVDHFTPFAVRVLAGFGAMGGEEGEGEDRRRDAGGEEGEGEDRRRDAGGEEGEGEDRRRDGGGEEGEGEEGEGE